MIGGYAGRALAGFNVTAADGLSKGAARQSSERLLRAQLSAGQHFITDPARFAAVCASVGLAT
jgi:hypothetical protein